MQGTETRPGVWSKRRVVIPVWPKWKRAQVCGKGMFKMWPMAAEEEPPWLKSATVLSCFFPSMAR